MPSSDCVCNFLNFLAKFPFQITQALPAEGYTKIFENMLLNKDDITVRLNVDYFQVHCLIVIASLWTNGLKRSVLAACNICFLKLSIIYFGINGLTPAGLGKGSPASAQAPRVYRAHRRLLRQPGHGQARVQVHLLAQGVHRAQRRLLPGIAINGKVSKFKFRISILKYIQENSRQIVHLKP